MPVTKPRPPRPHGLPALRDMPITFTRCTASEEANAAFAKLVGKSTDRATHSPTQYVSADGRWMIRCVQHSGYGTARSGRTHWHIAHDGRYFGVSYKGGPALSLEGAIDDIHRKIGKGVSDGFRVLADIRRVAEQRDRNAVKRADNRVRARDLLLRVAAADPEELAEWLAELVNLDALARAIEAAEATEAVQP